MKQSDANLNNLSNNNQQQLPDNDASDHLSSHPDLQYIMHGVEVEGLIADNKNITQNLINDFVKYTGRDPFKTTLITIFLFLSITMALDKFSAWSGSTARVSSLSLNIDREIQRPPVKIPSTISGASSMPGRQKTNYKNNSLNLPKTIEEEITSASLVVPLKNNINGTSTSGIINVLLENTSFVNISVENNAEIYLRFRLNRKLLNSISDNAMQEKIEIDSLCLLFNGSYNVKDYDVKHMVKQLEKTFDQLIKKYGSPALLNQFRMHADWQVADSNLTINKEGIQELSILLRHP